MTLVDCGCVEHPYPYCCTHEFHENPLHRNSRMIVPRGLKTQYNILKFNCMSKLSFDLMKNPLVARYVAALVARPLLTKCYTSGAFLLVFFAPIIRRGSLFGALADGTKKRDALSSIYRFPRIFPGDPRKSHRWCQVQMLKGRLVVRSHHGSLQVGRPCRENGSLWVLRFRADEPLHGIVDAKVVRRKDEHQVQDRPLVRPNVPRCAHSDSG